MKKILALVVLSLSLICGTLTIYANNTEDVKIENLSQKEVNRIVSSVTYGVFNNDTSDITEYAKYFTGDCFTNLYNYTMENNLEHESVVSSVIDFTYPENSSTGDTVIMVNAQILYDSTHKGLYLFEYHVDANGDIYGYNIWVY
jgi:hypothetical protein